MKRAGKKIALLSGDGIGPEVIRESVKVLDTLSSNSDINFSYYDAPIGAEAIDKYGCPSDGGGWFSLVKICPAKKQ